MELDIPRDQECSQKDAEMVEPCLSVANADIWHGWSSRTKIVAGMVPGYDPAFPQLGLQPPPVEVAHPSQHSQGDRDRDLGSSGKVGEGADNHLLEWAEGWGSLSPLEKANTTLGSRRWQTSLQTRSHVGVRTKQNV